jgi:hypothetical protein
MLRAGDAFHWVVNAFPASRVEVPPQDDGFTVEETNRPLPLGEASLAALLDRSVPVGPDRPPGRMPVFVPRRILDETFALAGDAGDVETGGALLGALRRDGNAGDVFVEITAQVPAAHTVADSTRVTFTPATWAAVQAAIALRGRSELLAGWWHLHPDACRLRGCPRERRARCAAASPFFSAEDVHLHTTCFPSAWHVALLVSDSTLRGMTWSLFGWSQGMVGARGFHVLDDRPTGGAVHAAHAAPGF